MEPQCRPMVRERLVMWTPGRGGCRGSDPHPAWAPVRMEQVDRRLVQAAPSCLLLL